MTVPAITKPITVLHVVGGLEFAGGTENFVRQLASLSIPGIESRIWVHRDFQTPAPPPAFVTEGQARHISRSLWNDLKAMGRDVCPLRAWVRAQARPLLYAHSRAGIFAACLVHWLTGTPLLIHLHFLAGHPWFYRWLQRLTGALMIYNSRTTCRHFGGHPAQSLIIMPSAVWPAEPLARRTGPRRFVAAGSFVRGKNFHRLVAAFQRARAEGLVAELHIFGLSDSPTDPVYQEQIVAACRSRDDIYLQGWTRDWCNQLAADDVFVHLGQPEAFGMVILEAFAAGCRLVVLPDTFLDELPEPQRSAGIQRLSRLSEEELAAAMQAAPLGEGASGLELWTLRQVAQPWFSLEGSLARLVKVYEAVAQPHAP